MHFTLHIYFHLGTRAMQLLHGWLGYIHPFQANIAIINKFGLPFTCTCSSFNCDFLQPSIKTQCHNVHFKLSKLLAPQKRTAYFIFSCTSHLVSSLGLFLFQLIFLLRWYYSIMIYWIKYHMHLYTHFQCIMFVFFLYMLCNNIETVSKCIDFFLYIVYNTIETV